MSSPFSVALRHSKKKQAGKRPHNQSSNNFQHFNNSNDGIRCTKQQRYTTSLPSLPADTNRSTNGRTLSTSATAAAATAAAASSSSCRSDNHHQSTHFRNYESRDYISSYPQPPPAGSPNGKLPAKPLQKKKEQQRSLQHSPAAAKRGGSDTDDSASYNGSPDLLADTPTPDKSSNPTGVGKKELGGSSKALAFGDGDEEVEVVDDDEKKKKSATITSPPQQVSSQPPSQPAISTATTTTNAIQPTSNNGISNNGNNNNGTEYPDFIPIYDVSRSAPHRQNYPQQYIPSSSSIIYSKKEMNIYSYAKDAKNAFNIAEDAAARNGKETFSFNVLYQRYMTAHQQTVFDQYKEAQRELYEIALNEGHCLLVDGPMSHCIDYSNKLFSMNTGNTNVYHVAEYHKTGVAGDSNVRVEMGYPAHLHIFSTVDIDNLPIGFQRMWTAQMIEKMRPFTFKTAPPITILDAIEEDMNGLPIATKYLLWSIVKEYDECKILGGGKEINGILIAAYKMILEGGEQQYREMNLLPTQKSSNLHEGGNSACLGYYLSRTERIRTDIDDCFDAFPSRQRRRLLEGSSEPTIEGSWDPKNDPGQECYAAATKLYYDKTVGGENWKDSQHKGPIPGQRCHDPSHYTFIHKDDSMHEKELVILSVSLHGGKVGMDRDPTNMEARGGVDMVAWIMSLRIFGEDGPTWEHHWTFGENVVLVMYVEFDDLDRIIVVHQAPGNMFESRPTMKFSYTQLKKICSAAEDMQWMKDFFHKLRTPNEHLITESRKPLDSPVEDDVLFCNLVAAHLGLFCRVPQKVCVLFEKNMLVGGSVNLFEEHYNRLRKKGYFDIVSSSARHGLLNRPEDYSESDLELTELESDDEFEDEPIVVADIVNQGEFSSTKKVSRDSKGMRRVVHFLSTGNVERAVHYLRHNKKGEKIEASGRKKLLKDAKVIKDELEEQFNAEYDRTGDNTGNRSTTASRHNPTISYSDMLDRRLQSYADSGEKFFVMIEGTADPKNGGPYNKDESSFVKPADGTMIVYEEEVNKKKNNVTTTTYVPHTTQFRAADFVPITYEGLRTRCKPVHKGKAKTNRHEAVHFTNHMVEYNEKMMQFGRDRYNDHNVVEVRLTLKVDPDTGKKRRNNGKDGW